MDEAIARIKGYIRIVNPAIEEDDLLDFCIDEVVDRVVLYLNRDDIPVRIERIIAKIVNTGLKKCQEDIKESETGEIKQEIRSISDNGQSITYENRVTSYFTSKTDEELFTGFHQLLNRYRRINVVHSKIDE